MASKRNVPWFVVVLVVSTLVSRWPFRTQYLFDWDAANFALALDAYDVTVHQPHPPGYLLFVAAAYFARFWTREANSALIAVALVLSAAAVVTQYILGREMFGERVGRWAALLLLGSVSFWGYGCIGLSYPALAVFSALVALYTYRTAVLHQDRVLAAAVAYAVGSGFRPDLALFLAPLLGASLLAVRRARGVLALGIAAFGCLVWLGATVALSGGPGAYLAALTGYVDADVLQRYAAPRLGLAALVANVEQTLRYTWYALYAIVLLVPAAIVGWMTVFRRAPARSERCALLFVLLWTAPMVLFYGAIHIGHPGYVFSFLPALLVVVARGSEAAPLPRRWSTRRGAVLAAAVGVVLVANVAVFLFYPRLLTAQGLRLHDAIIGARLDAIRQYADPHGTVLVAYESFRHLAYYLPHYEHRVWLDVTTSEERAIPLPAGARDLLLVDTRLVALAEALPGTVLTLPGHERVKLIRLPPSADGRMLVYRPGRLTVDPPLEVP